MNPSAHGQPDADSSVSPSPPKTGLVDWLAFIAQGDYWEPARAYEAAVAQGLLEPDPAQEQAVAAIQRLWERLDEHTMAAATVRQPATPGTPTPGGLLGRLLSRRPPRSQEAATPSAPAIKGLYLVGDVGRGKSMLMDLLFATARVQAKKRVHVHAFMQSLHQALHARQHSAEVLPAIAADLTQHCRLLCFDEWQVTEIGDAMLLGRLLEQLWARGVVVVVTSNTAPDALLAHAPGRDSFLPSIQRIKANMEVVALQGAVDHRRRDALLEQVWCTPDDAAARKDMERLFTQLTAGHAVHDERLTVWGREIVVEKTAAGVAWFTFAALCEQPLGTADYLALASRFHTIVLVGIPRLGGEQRDALRRFIHLVDVLFEHQARLLASAATEVEALCPQGKTGAFARTASRLHAMGTPAYLAHSGPNRTTHPSPIAPTTGPGQSGHGQP